MKTGNSDTISCITGGIAEAFYGEIPEAIITEACKRIPEEFWTIIDAVQENKTDRRIVLEMR